MNLLNLFESNDSGFQALDAWKQQVLQAHPDHAGKIKFLGRDNQVSAEVPGMDRSFGVFDLDTEQGQVLDEAHNNYHANRTGFAKPQRNLSGEGEPEGMFAVVIDGQAWKEFTSNKAFAVAKTIAAKYPNKTVQVKWPTGQLNTVKEEWSQKYKSSINCSHPRGFSQRAHCAGKNKHNESIDMEMVCEDCGMCETHGNHMMEVKQRLDAKCWTGKKIGNPKTKIKGGIRVNNCVPAESVAEGVAETIPWKEAQTVLNHYGADYFGTSYDKLYFYKYRKQFSIGLIRDENGNGNHSVNLSELNAMVRKLRSMRVPLSPFGEGELNEFVTPQATAQDPGLEREKDVDVIIFGRMPQDFEFSKVVQAIEAVLPREYPPGSSPSQRGMPASPAELIGSEIVKNGGAVVTTKPLSIAQKVVKEFQARGIKCRINAPGSKQGVAKGSLNEFAVFLNPTTVVVGQAHGQPLELSPNTLKQIQAIAAKHGAWYEGNGTDRGYTKGQIDRYVGSWDDEVAKTANSNDPKWLYVLFANVDENNRVQRVGVDPNDTIFNRLLATAKDNSFQGIGYTSQALQKFLQMTSEGKYDFLKMSQQPATQENLTRFLKAGEALMWPSNWEQYPNKAGKIAKAATVDVRDQYLATRKAGVYVTGSGHLKAVQNITGKQGVAEGSDNPWGDQGNFAGDTPVNIGGATVKPIQVGDTVTYLGQRAKILAQSPDRKHSRITIAKGMGGVVQTVLTSDLKRSGLGEDKNVIHRIGLTVTDPNHPMVSKRGETIQKTVRVTGGNQEQAINRAIAHHRKKGYKVHDHHYIGTADSPVQELADGPGQETGFGAEGSKKLGTVNTELISRAWRENRPNVVLTFGNSGEYRLDRGMIRYLLGYYKSLPDDNSKWYFIYETMSRLEKLVALLEKANLPNSEIPAAGQQELDLTEKKRPKDDLSSAGARDADVQRALQRARAATPTASSDMGALVKQDLQTQEKTQQKLADIEADNQRQMDMLKKNDSVNVDQQRAIRSLERQVSKVPGMPTIAKAEPTPAPKKSAVAPVAPAVEPARIPPMARPRPTIGNKVPADVSIPSISLPPLPDPSTAVQNPNIAVQNPTRLQIPAPSQGQQTVLPALTPQAMPQYNTTDAVDVDFRHLGAAPNLDNFDEPEEPQKKTGTYGEGIQETANNMVKFSIDGERAYDAVMDRFGHIIDWSNNSMTAPRKFWPRIEELAHDFGGEASEEGSEFALGE